jgi:DNA polymerase-3 subunit gamma/tau
MIASILTADAAYGLNLINHISDQGTDPRQFALDMVEYLRLVMLAQTRGVEALSFEVGEDAIAPILEQANSYPRRALLDALTAFNEAAQDKSSGWQPQLPLEMAFLKSLESLHNPYEVPATAQAAPVERAAVKSSPAASAKAAPHIEESAVPLPAGDVPPLTRIIDQWEEVKRGVKQYNRPAEAVLRSGSIIGLEGNSILFQVQSDILRDKIQSPETRELIEHVLQHIFGVPLKFTCRVGDMSAGGTNQIQNLMAEDSLLSFGINDLGGTIKEIKEIEPDEEE